MARKILHSHHVLCGSWSPEWRAWCRFVLSPPQDCLPDWVGHRDVASSSLASPWDAAFFTVLSNEKEDLTGNAATYKMECMIAGKHKV
jgi:hypothetical protein